MEKKFISLLALISSMFFCEDKAIAQNVICTETSGYNMLLIGNSFFKPYAQKMDELALEAGFVDHNDTIIIRGGAFGQPISFWNDSTSEEHLSIKSILDQGNIDIFGMTSGHDAENPNDRIEGQRAWIEYALQNNPNVTVFIAIPQIDYPDNWDSFAQTNGFNNIYELYDYFVNELVHNTMIEQLRIEFPSTNIFTIPTGWATFKLVQMLEDSLLLDEITMSGPTASSLVTDERGHQGQIVIETGSLVWLSSIYNVDLSTNTYETGFNTDLHSVAEEIMNSHDPDYKKCIDEITSISEVSNNMIRIFPNPSSDVINIIADNELDFEATLYDLYGKALSTSANISQIKVGTLTPGLYLLEIKDINSERSVFKKLLITN